MQSNYKHRWLDGQAIDLPNGKTVCVGRNYADHISEMNSATPTQPVLFLKPSSALCDANSTIKVSQLEPLGELHHELEIAILIGDANAIIGVGLGIDLTLRDVQKDLKQKGLPWERAKAFDGSCAVSKFIAYPNDTLKLDKLDLELVLNGKCQQKSNSSLMLYSIENLMHEISAVFTLNAGDIILTGTPAGVGPLVKGDVISGFLDRHTLIDNTLIA